MDKLTQSIPSLGRIDLARETDFMLGPARVRPSRCEVEGGDKARHGLQRRVMQVLVALARSPNDVVSQPELISRCWGGLSVSEDAIGRCIGQLRKLAAAWDDPPFAIETIPGVGYRLEVEERRRLQVGAGPAREPLLAVLAFDNLSAEPEMKFFSDGVSGEILDTVARGSGIKVIAPSSSFQFRGPEKVASKVAFALKATHLLDGSVRRDGSRIRIAAHLVDCASETTIWSDRFERELVDVFALQDEIAGAVAGALNTALAPNPKPAVIRTETYEAYLQAQPMVYQELHYVDEAAIALLEQVVAEAPTFAAAWENLAVARAKRLRSDGAAEPFAGARAAAVEAAETALRLDPSRGRAHLALALLEPWAAYAKREAHLDRAVATNANDAVLIMSRARQLGYVGRGLVGLEEARRAASLDPLPPLNKVAITSGLSQLGRFQECLDIWDEWVRNPLRGNLSPALAQSAALGDWARHDAYLALLAPGQPIVAGPFDAVLRRFFATLRTNDRASMLQVLAEARVTVRETGTVPLNTLAELDLYGLHDELFELVEVASFDHMFRDDGPLPLTMFGPNIIFNAYNDGALQADPRFLRLCAKLGLVSYWLESGAWPYCADVVPYDFRAQARAVAERA